MPFTPKEPIDKLPLTDRKDIRDNYEPKKEQGERDVASALKLSNFTFKLDANKIWVYNKAGWQNPGSILASFAGGFANAVVSFAQAYGDEGIHAFNSVVYKSKMTVKVNETGDAAPQFSTRIKDGTFHILFHHEKLGHYANTLSKDDIVSAIDGIPHEGLTLEAKISIRQKWGAEHDELRRDIADMVGIPNLRLEPNFEENFIRVRPAKKSDINFGRYFGFASTAYFTGLRDKLKQDKVKDDDLIQEGIQEALGQKIIKLRVVDKTKCGDFNGTASEGGILYLETTPNRWGFAPNQVAEGLLSSL